MAASNRFPETDYIRERAHALRLGLFFRLQEFVDDFPSGAPQQFIRILEDILDKVANAINRATDKRKLTLVCKLIDQLSDELSVLDNAHTARTPRGLAQMLSKLAEATGQASSLIVVAPHVENNYSIVDLRPWLLEITENVLTGSEHATLAEKLPPRFNLVHFPRIDRDNVLVHAIFGHEFGHPIADQYLEKYLVSKEGVAHSDEMRTAVATHVARYYGKAEKTEQDTRQIELTQIVNNIFRAGMRELLSDAVAVHLFGPSAIFAALDVFLKSELDQLPRAEDYHPPSRYRIRLIHEQLKALGYYNSFGTLPASAPAVKTALDETLNFVDEVVAEDKDRKVLDGRAPTRIAYQWIEKIKARALEDVKTTLAGAAADAAKFASEVPGLVERLLIGVPACELGIWPSIRSVDWRSGLLAAWLLKIRFATDNEMSLAERTRAITELHKLALSGIEYTLLREAYSAGAKSA